MTTHNLPPLPVGTKVRKTSSKPFKSDEKINTIKGTVMHPKLNLLCYTFEEDESYVEARRCIIAQEELTHVGHDCN